MKKFYFFSGVFLAVTLLSTSLLADSNDIPTVEINLNALDELRANTQISAPFASGGTHKTNNVVNWEKGPEGKPYPMADEPSSSRKRQRKSYAEKSRPAKKESKTSIASVKAELKKKAAEQKELSSKDIEKSLEKSLKNPEVAKAPEPAQQTPEKVENKAAAMTPLPPVEKPAPAKPEEKKEAAKAVDAAPNLAKLPSIELPKTGDEPAAKTPPALPDVKAPPAPTATPVANKPAAIPATPPAIPEAPKLPDAPAKAPDALAKDSDAPALPKLPEAPAKDAKTPEAPALPALPKAPDVKPAEAPADANKDPSATEKLPALPQLPTVNAEKPKAENVAPPALPAAPPAIPEAPKLPDVAATKPDAQKPAAQTVAPTAKIAEKTPGELAVTVLFVETETELPLAVQGQLKEIVGKVKGSPNAKLAIAAYAAGSDEQASAARRISLSRALAVRSFLIDNGIDGMRINIQAMGNRHGDGPADRVDVFLNEKP